MHIPWGWIKQRPHFFAEYLSAKYCVDVWYRKANTVAKKKLLTSTEVGFPNLTVEGFTQIPFNKLPILKYCSTEWINSALMHLQLPVIDKYDYVWVSSPTMYLAVKPMLHNQILIYDCMDDMAEFPNIKEKEKNEIIAAEKKILTEADIVIVSSDYLKKKILYRANLDRENVFIVNNAIELPDSKVDDKFPLEIESKVSYVKSLSYTLMYVGMVSEWFDFPLMIKLLDKFPEINLVLLGPCDTKIPKHDRIHYLGIVERKYIFTLMKESYALIMPFVLNELIYSVNPVKLYEYIFTGKPVISVGYGETEKFSNFVHLYNNFDQLASVVEKVISDYANCIKSSEEIDSFIFNNTWKARCQQVINILDNKIWKH